MQMFNLAEMTRRVYQRYRLDGAVTLVAKDGVEEPSVLKDLSCSGAGVITHQPLEIDEKMDVIIPPSYLFDKSIFRYARVAWCEQLTSGLWQGGLDFGIHTIPLSL